MSHWESHILELVHGGRFFSIRKAQPAGLSFSLLAVTYFIPFLSFWFGLLGWFWKMSGLAWQASKKTRWLRLAALHVVFWCVLLVYFFDCEIEYLDSTLFVYEVWLVVTAVCIQSVFSNGEISNTLMSRAVIAMRALILSLPSLLLEERLSRMCH
jgi:hypothetical protein